MASTLRAAELRAPSVSPRGVTATDGLLLLMALIWGVNFAVVKFATGALAPLAFNMLPRRR